MSLKCPEISWETTRKKQKGEWKTDKNGCHNTKIISFQNKERREDVQQSKKNKERVKSKVAGGVLEVSGLLLERNCPEAIFYVSEAAAETGQVGASTEVGTLAGLQALGASANAGVASARASTKVTAIEVCAQARAAGPEASANAVLLEGVLEANSKAVTAEAAASAGVGVEHLGAKAEANAVVGKVSAGIKHTPLKVHAQGPGANAETGISWDYTGATVGASAGEARAGPFAVRAGVAFGAGIRNGVPEIDMGPVTVPCGIM